jgi:glycosyltransferase involved in cell wall biosynthesis
VANALEQLLSSQSLYNRMSEDALKLALFYDWKRIAAMYVDSLQRFLERHDK